MKITWYGHSCFKIDSAQGSAVIDPYEPGSVPGLELPPLEADAVFCTHAHRDHGFREGVRLTGKEPSFASRLIPTFHDEVHGRKRGKNDMVLIKAEGFTVLHMGDIGCELSAEQILDIGHADVLLIPVGGFYTVDAPQAHRIAGELKADIVIPMHYRSGSVGYDVLDTADKFIALSENVTEPGGNSLELPSGITGTVILNTERI